MLQSSRKDTPTVSELERADRLREVLGALNEVNRLVPIVVEGKRDAEALRRLGLSGTIITLHSGKSLYDFCEDISLRFERVVLLLDWDSTGNGLDRELRKNLQGHWEEFYAFRELIKVLCQKDIANIEGIPKLLKRLEGFMV